LEVEDNIETATAACTQKGFVVARVQSEAIFMEIANDVEVTIFTRATERLIIACIQLNAVSGEIAEEGAHHPAIFMEIADDVEVAILACPTKRLVVARVQVGTILMKSTNGLQVAKSGGLANRLISALVFSCYTRSENRKAIQ
jgi:hypothetical protein